MSSIERAMDKLESVGAKRQEAQAVSESPQAPSMPSNDLEKAMDRRDGVAPTGVEERHRPGGDRSLEPSSTSKPPPMAPSSEAKQRTSPADIHGAETAVPDKAAFIPTSSQPRNHVVLDLERMAATGILTSNALMTHQAEELQRIKRRLLGNMVPGIYDSARPPNLILITSSVPGEGKTFTSTNLAMSIAMEVDHTVLAIDCDPLKRDMSKLLGVSDRPGLFDFLADQSQAIEPLLVRTSIPNLTVIPAGKVHHKSTEMLASSRMQDLTDELASRYRDRVIIFDSPPVMAMSTVVALAPLVGQVVLVAEAGRTTHDTLKETLHRMEGINITGVVLNKSKQSYVSDYDYYGSYRQQR